MLAFHPVQAHLGRLAEWGNRLMQDRTLTTNGSNAELRTGEKARWHAPTLKRLDVDLTAGNKRNSTT